MTLTMAVSLLSEQDEEVQITAANFIQNQCFSSAEAKKKVRKPESQPFILCRLTIYGGPMQCLKGIPRNILGEGFD